MSRNPPNIRTSSLAPQPRTSSLYSPVTRQPTRPKDSPPSANAVISEQDASFSPAMSLQNRNIQTTMWTYPASDFYYEALVPSNSCLMNKSRAELSHALFSEWRHRSGSEAERLCEDGVIHEATYEQAHLKVLFLAKEPNYPEGKGFDFRDWWSKEIRYRFAHRLSEWAYGLLNKFPPLSEFDTQEGAGLDAMRSVAFMNLKKTGGSGSTDLDLLKASVERERDLLIRQIEIVSPEVVVGALGQTSLWYVLFPDLELKPSGFDIAIGRHGEVKIIDFYHPSYRVPRAMSYALLGRVCESVAFGKI